jgi:F-type H+-transporting ATPase subunit delta
MDAAAKTLAKRYARAYMGLDGKAFSSELEGVARAKLAGLRHIFEASRPFLKTLTHPAINGSVKLEVLARILGPENKGTAAVFVGLLVREDRFNLLEDILDRSPRLYDSFCGVLRAEVYSRYNLSEGELKRVGKMLADMTGKKIHLCQFITERVIGGFEIKVGDLLIDATLKGRLERLKKELFAV